MSDDNREFDSGLERGSKIMQTIEDIYGFIENCKMPPLSSTKVIVPKDELYDLLDELRTKTPDEVKRYRKMLANRTQIIKDAEEKAAEILADAREQYNVMVEEHAIVQEAYRQAEITKEEARHEADAILAEANKNVQEIYQGAIAYTDELLYKAEKIISRTYNAFCSNSEALVRELGSGLEQIRANREELAGDAGGSEDAVETATTESVAATESVPKTAGEEDTVWKEQTQNAAGESSEET